MSPLIWGNGAWLIIYIIILTNFKDIDNMKYLLYLIIDGLPCNQCIENIREEIDKSDLLNFENSIDILKFFIEVRNKFQKNKNRLECYIDLNHFNTNKLTLKHKALIFNSFYYNSTIQNDEKIKKIKTIIYNTLNE